MLSIQGLNLEVDLKLHVVMKFYTKQKTTNTYTSICCKLRQECVDLIMFTPIANVINVDILGGCINEIVFHKQIIFKFL